MLAKTQQSRRLKGLISQREKLETQITGSGFSLETELRTSREKSRRRSKCLEKACELDLGDSLEMQRLGRRDRKGACAWSTGWIQRKDWKQAIGGKEEKDYPPVWSFAHTVASSAFGDTQVHVRGCYPRRALFPRMGLASKRETLTVYSTVPLDHTKGYQTFPSPNFSAHRTSNRGWFKMIRIPFSFFKKYLT